MQDKLQTDGVQQRGTHDNLTERRNPDKLQKRQFSNPKDKFGLFQFDGLFCATVECVQLCQMKKGLPTSAVASKDTNSHA